MKVIKGPQVTVAELQHAKVRITTCLDEDVVLGLKKMAGESGNKYQTLLNQILREYIFGQALGVLSRIAKLEQKVFKRQKLA